MAKKQWVALTEWDSLPAAELKKWLVKARVIMLGKLSKKMQVALG
jgi:predicted DNA-binding protein (MmcQ/YjbR family)